MPSREAALFEFPAASLLAALQYAHPHWVLGPRSAASVFVADIYYGDLRSLDELRADEIMSIAYLSASETVLRYGTRHPGPSLVIQVGPESP